jgi:hypothetical protein
MVYAGSLVSPGHHESPPMDAEHFDRLTRSLMTPGSRRRALSALLGGCLGLLGATEIGAKKPNQKRRACPPCKKRKRGKCKGQLPDGTPCAGGTCQGGMCQPPGDPCPGQKRCAGRCIPTNQCCTAEDCPALPGYRCCQGVCTDTKGGTGFSCNVDPECCSGYCRRTSSSGRTCAATCRGKGCFQGSGCCPEHPCLALNRTGQELCGGCLDRSIFCESDDECCASACTAPPGSTLKACLSNAGGPCEEDLDCRPCYENNECFVTTSGGAQHICTNGVCGCPDDCCADFQCEPNEVCVFDPEGLNGVCQPIVQP